jgi:2-polyprenyl-6-methoxyphenol hydroxylase-like FAD-dependent oxidoreductase
MWEERVCCTWFAAAHPCAAMPCLTPRSVCVIVSPPQVKSWLLQEVDMKEDATERADKIKRKAAARAQVHSPPQFPLTPARHADSDV